MNSPTKLLIGWKRPILFFVLHPDNFSPDEAIALKAQRLGLWWSKNYQRDAQKKKISLDLLVLLDQAK
ncbi:hypothetical protein [Lutimonas vermicola]|uniref:Uncharacterized protein n=1 Tax=Lutimonas vermicola TaxID=414288 RepID=A0ABU9KZ81_9FLAO